MFTKVAFLCQLNCEATFKQCEKQNPEYALTVFECPSNSESEHMYSWTKAIMPHLVFTH